MEIDKRFPRKLIVLKFRIDDCGHVYVKGALSSQRHNGHEQDVTIENDFDQTSLSDFA